MAPLKILRHDDGCVGKEDRAKVINLILSRGVTKLSIGAINFDITEQLITCMVYDVTPIFSMSLDGTVNTLSRPSEITDVIDALDMMLDESVLIDII